MDIEAESEHGEPSGWGILALLRRNQVGKRLCSIDFQQSFMEKAKLPQSNSELFIAGIFDVLTRPVRYVFVFRNFSERSIGIPDKRYRGAAIAMVGCNYHHAVTRHRPGNLTVRISRPSESVREDHEWPSLGLGRRW
jgi:hypothetical protein